MVKSLCVVTLAWLMFSNLQSQVGIGNSTPNGVLDLTNSSVGDSSKTYPFITPSMAGANAEDLVINPKSGKGVVAGSIFYDLTEKCLKVYDGTTWGCVGKTAETPVEPERFGCPAYSSDKKLSSSLAANQMIGYLVVERVSFPNGTFTIGDILAIGSNGEELAVKEVNPDSVGGVPNSGLVNDPEKEYVVTVSIKNPEKVNSSSQYSYQPPLGGDPTLSREDYCEWKFY